LSSAGGSQSGVTPGSVKVLMLIEAGIIGFLLYWVASEYTYSAIFRTYFNEILLDHLTTYGIELGVGGIALTASVVAIVMYKNIRSVKRRLETLAVPKVKGVVEKAISGVPSTMASSSLGIVQTVSQSRVPATAQPATAIVPVPEKNEPKSQSS
jgi:hypothetical protein